MKHPYIIAAFSAIGVLYLLRDGRREFRDCAIIAACVFVVVLGVLS